MHIYICICIYIYMIYYMIWIIWYKLYNIIIFFCWESKGRHRIPVFTIDCLHSKVPSSRGQALCRWHSWLLLQGPDEQPLIHISPDGQDVRTRLKRWPRWLQNLALRRPCSLKHTEFAASYSIFAGCMTTCRVTEATHGAKQLTWACSVVICGDCLSSYFS